MGLFFWFCRFDDRIVVLRVVCVSFIVFLFSWCGSFGELSFLLLLSFPPLLLSLSLVHLQFSHDLIRFPSFLSLSLSLSFLMCFR